MAGHGAIGAFAKIARLCAPRPIGPSVASPRGMRKKVRYSSIALGIAAALVVIACNKADTAAGSNANNNAVPEAPAASAGRTYTCPMDPEVVQKGPGRCPKCGMALVPKAP
jgi:hypothetical protein